MANTHTDHRYRPAVPEDDGCLYSIHRCTCGAFMVKKKRRPKHIRDTECTWMIPCADHAKTDQAKRKFIIDHVRSALEDISKVNARAQQKQMMLRAVARQLIIEAAGMKDG